MSAAGEPAGGGCGVIAVITVRILTTRPPSVVHLPRGIRSKHKLFAILADKLRFPAYFGWNWDACEELLRDLSWLPGQPIVIVHEDLPFGAGGENRPLYEQLIRDVALHWQAVQPGRLQFVVPINAG